jgi:colicin import membrane protein
MVRKLKIYQMSLGFFDQAVAAPSMKAALEAWGANTNLFHQGVARETNDPAVVAATMSHPGVVLKRPVGSNGPFVKHAELPTDLSSVGLSDRPGKRLPKATHDHLATSTLGRLAKLRWRSRKLRDSANVSGGRKKSTRRRSVSGASRQSQTRKQHWKKPSGSMTRGRVRLSPSAPLSKNGRNARMPVGRSRKRS